MATFFPKHGHRPGIDAISQTSEKEIWWGRQERLLYYANNIIDSTAVDAGNTPTTTLRAGLVMGKQTSDGNLYQWNPDATDGTEVVMGILAEEINMLDANGSVEDKFGIPVILAGQVKVADLLIEGTAFTSAAGEHQARRQMAGRILLDDDQEQSLQPAMTVNREIAKTAAYTVLETDSGTLFTTTGATGAVTFTLPAITVSAGLVFEFLNVADQDMTVASAAGDDIVTFNDLAADSIAFSTASEKIGGWLRVFCNAASTKWYAQNLSPGNTLTIAT